MTQRMPSVMSRRLLYVNRAIKRGDAIEQIVRARKKADRG